MRCVPSTVGETEVHPRASTPGVAIPPALSEVHRRLHGRGFAVVVLGPREQREALLGNILGKLCAPRREPCFVRDRISQAQLDAPTNTCNPFGLLPFRSLTTSVVRRLYNDTLHAAPFPSRIHLERCGANYSRAVGKTELKTCSAFRFRHKRMFNSAWAAYLSGTSMVEAVGAVVASIWIPLVLLQSIRHVGGWLYRTQATHMNRPGTNKTMGSYARPTIQPLAVQPKSTSIAPRRRSMVLRIYKEHCRCATLCIR